MDTSKKRRAAELLKFLCIAVFLVLFFSGRWAYAKWDSLSWEELVFQLQTLEGTGGGMVERYLLEALLPAAITFALILVFYLVLKKRTDARERRFSLAVLVCSGGAFVAMAALFGHSLGILRYYRASTSGEIAKTLDDKEFIEYYYADPQEVELTFPEKKRNLIYIFLESYEMTYADASVGGAFPENVLPHLTEVAMENDDFSKPGELNGGVAYNGANWTMGAMFAQSSGLPLKVPTSLIDRLDTVNFFPDITTLGDILEAEGYQNEIMMGSFSEFGGRRNYYENHGDYYVLDIMEAYERKLIPEDYYVWWGIDDGKLIEIAKEEIARLDAADEPWNLSFLTVDTHFEDGYLCPDCEDNFGDNNYADVFYCSSKRIAEFVEWAKQQDFYENTTIVICGDHLTMDSDFCNDVDPEYQRRTYTAIVNSAAGKDDTYRQYSTFDMFPTTLAAMGVEIEGDRLGLGVNLYSDEATLTEKYGVELVDAVMAEKSDFTSRLSGLEE